MQDELLQTGEQTPVRPANEIKEPQEHKQFTISQKTTNDRLRTIKWATDKAPGSFDGKQISMRDVIADDIIKNFSEVASDIAWGEVVGLIKVWVPQRRQSYGGSYAISLHMAQSLGSVAAAAGWDMSSPPMVYMSAHHARIALPARITFMEEEVEKFKTGHRRFPTIEETMAKKDAEDAEIVRLKSYQAKIEDDLAEYATQYLQKDTPEATAAYTSFLRDLTYISNSDLSDRGRARVLTLATELSQSPQLDEVKLAEANSLLQKKKKK